MESKNVIIFVTAKVFAVHLSPARDATNHGKAFKVEYYIRIKGYGCEFSDQGQDGCLIDENREERRDFRRSEVGNVSCGSAGRFHLLP